MSIKKYSVDTLGNTNAKHLIYLPTPPRLPDGQISTQSIIELNGNHWRKIFTIIAKLLCQESDWRNYRDHKLLQESCFVFENNLIEQPATQHYICGKAHWRALNLEPCLEVDVAYDTEGKAWKKQQQDGLNIMLLPYPDYRQFNNALIELIKPSVQR